MVTWCILRMCAEYTTMIHIIYTLIAGYEDESPGKKTPFLAKWCICDTIFSKVVYMRYIQPVPT